LGIAALGLGAYRVAVVLALLVLVHAWRSGISGSRVPAAGPEASRCAW
jgi:hypothetical protein